MPSFFKSLKHNKLMPIITKMRKPAQTAQSTAEHKSVPQKILDKKSTRGKPFYKIKWQGIDKKDATWESAARLRHYKQMVNEYETKKWGMALDDKFFNDNCYAIKAPSRSRQKKEVVREKPKRIATKSKSLKKQEPALKKLTKQKDVTVQKKKRGRGAPRKVKAPETESEQQQQEQRQEEENPETEQEQSNHNKTEQKKGEENNTDDNASSQSSEQQESADKNEEIAPVVEDEVPVAAVYTSNQKENEVYQKKQFFDEPSNIERNIEDENKDQDKNMSQQVPNIQNLKIQANTQDLPITEQKPNYEIAQQKFENNYPPQTLQQNQNQIAPQSEMIPEQQYQFQNNAINQQKQFEPQIQPKTIEQTISHCIPFPQVRVQEDEDFHYESSIINRPLRSKILQSSSQVSITVERTIKQIVRIDHLVKASEYSHQYLIEFNTKQFAKMRTSELLKNHSEQFLQYLQKEYRIKYS